LYLNNLANINIKCEVLEGVDINNLVKVNREKYWMQDFFIKS